MKRTIEYYGACDFVKVETPENATDDMLVW